MAKKKDYSADDIKVLTDREHVRLRTQIYLGSTKKTTYNVPLFINGFEIKQVEFIPAVYKAVGEILDNAIDEFAQISNPAKKLTIEGQPALGMYTITDNGRGVPIDIHPVGRHTPEVVFGQLRSGRNFDDDKQTGVIGQNGVGSACVNFCSTEFSIDVHRDNKRYRQTFSNGGEEISKPVIKKSGETTGTSISFQLDNQVFEDIGLPPEVVENRAIEIALTNTDIITEYNGKKYHFRKGFDELLRKVSTNYFKFEDGNLEFYVVFDVHDGIDEQIFTWVNSSLLFDGGICNTQFLNGFYDKVISHTQKEAKKHKCEVTKNDVRQNLLILGNLKLRNPEYDAQSKTRLTGPNLRKEIGELIDNNWSSFARKNKDWLTAVTERAIIRHHTHANTKAIKQHQKNLNKKIPGLIDATGKNRFDCQIIITEGDSAASMITETRDPKTTASLPLRGKVNNVYGSTAAQILNMGKVTDLLSAIGLVPGHKAMRSDLRYGKIVIATDADYDGDDIFTLLVNLFHQHWPELFDPNYQPIIYRLVAPNVCLVKGKQRIHIPSRQQYEKVKDKYKGYEVKYFKGLGSMSREDWDMILSGKTNTLIPITDDGKMKETLKLLFGPDADARKGWLQGE